MTRFLPGAKKKRETRIQIERQLAETGALCTPTIDAASGEIHANDAEELDKLVETCADERGNDFLLKHGEVIIEQLLDENTTIVDEITAKKIISSGVKPFSPTVVRNCVKNLAQSRLKAIRV